MCPSCKKNVKPMIIDVDTVLCVECGMTFSRSLQPKINVFKEQAVDPRPPLPTNIKPPLNAIVCDFAMDSDGNAVFASRVYCPKDEVEETPFDPNSNDFKFAFKVHRKKFKNRRRYMYDTFRKMAQQAETGEVSEPTEAPVHSTAQS